MSDKEELREIAQALLAVEGHLQACCACCMMEQCITAKTEYNLALEALKRVKARLYKLVPPVNWEKKDV